MNVNRIAQFYRDYAFAGFALPLGIILLAMSYFFFMNLDNTRHYIKTPATVSKVELSEAAHRQGDTYYEATYTITVKYSVAGQAYEEEYGFFPEMKVGDSVTISYNPENPRDIAQPIGVIWPVAMLIGGIVSLVAGVISIIRTHAKNKALKEQEEEWIHG